jgi:hypothetical protein
MLEGCAFMYACTEQQSGQLLTGATDNHRLRSGGLAEVYVCQEPPQDCRGGSQDEGQSCLQS